MKRLALLALFVSPAWAGDGHDHHVAETDGIRVQHVWTVAGTNPAPVWMEVINTSGHDIDLTGASAGWGKLALEGVRLSGGQAVAEPIAELPIPAGARMALEPGGPGFMATLTGPLTEGAHLDLDLHFGDTKIETVVEVLPKAATRHPHAGHDH